MRREFRYTRYLFRCGKCHGILSIPYASVSGTTSIGEAIIAHGASKELMVESIGSSHSLLLVNSEYSVVSLRAAMRPIITNQLVRPAVKVILTVYACPTCNGDVSEDDAECPHCHTAFEDA